MSHTLIWVVHEVADGEIVKFVGASKTDGGGLVLAADDAKADARKMNLGQYEKIKLDMVSHGEKGFEVILDHPAWQWRYTLCPATIFEGP